MAPTTQREHDGSTDTGPDRRQEVAAIGPDEVCDEDADDESGLETLAKADQIVAEHGRETLQGCRCAEAGSPVERRLKGLARERQATLSNMRKMTCPQLGVDNRPAGCTVPTGYITK